VTTKREYQQENRLARHLLRRVWWRCFWTWPLGHDFSRSGDYLMCIYCGKPWRLSSYQSARANGALTEAYTFAIRQRLIAEPSE
jgi:hypothetical protein